MAVRPDETISCEYLVIGAGVAGLRAAIELAPLGRVLVIAKDRLTESSSEYAQGGIAAALNDDDTMELHEQDTLAAGDGLCDPAAVHALVNEGPAAIEELLEWGAGFDREGGELVFTREGAHSRNRILHAHGDSTGREIVATLWKKAQSLPSIRMMSFAAVTDLMTSLDGAVAGAIGFDQWSSRVVAIQAQATLLATGGAGRVYRYTTNPDVATGDGIAMSHRAGAIISDLEFVQFHPTALCVPGAPSFLLSEALRGEGAVLRNIRGETFMQNYTPMAELAPRDVVSRSILREMQRTGAPHVLLDMTARGADFVAKRFPRIHETCLRYGVDIGRSPAPVSPAAHYLMGGVKVDLDGRSSLRGLFAAGETACTGVHGANRLASNSLLEGLVFGARAARAMKETVGFSAVPQLVDDARFPMMPEAELRNLAWNECSVMRNGAGLRNLLARLDAVNMAPLEKPTRNDWDRRSLHAVCRMMAVSALAREESRGGHYRDDFPEKREEFRRHSELQGDAPVRFV
jgi:L-aspartate oxidase